MRHFRSAVSLFVVAVLAACSATHTGSGDQPGTGGPTAEEACTEEARASCAILETCARYSLEETYGDLATCNAREKLACMLGFNSPGTSRTPARTKSCADALAVMSCDTYLYAYSNHIPDGCMTKPGALPDGAPCGGNSQCSGTRCTYPAAADATCGTCMTRLPVGSMCTANSNCQFGLLCALQDPVLATRVCVKPVEEGQACSAMLPCRGRNVGELQCVNGLCAKPLGRGALCDPLLDTCDFLWTGVTCDPQTRTCQPLLLLAAAGAPCGMVGTSSVGCSGGGVCSFPDAASAQGTCRPPLPDGSPCDPLSTVDYCRWPAGCLGGVCKISDPAACK